MGARKGAFVDGIENVVEGDAMGGGTLRVQGIDGLHHGSIQRIGCADAGIALEPVGEQLCLVGFTHGG